MEKRSDWLYVPSDFQSDDISTTYSGFGFEDIKNDVFGRSRSDKNRIGAISQPVPENDVNFDRSEYGAGWYSPEKTQPTAKIIAVNPAKGELSAIISGADHGDILELAGGIYQLDKSIVVDKTITIRSGDKSLQAQIHYSGAENTPVFRMHPKGKLSIENVTIRGSGEEYVFAPRENNMSAAYQLFVSTCRIDNFKHVLKAFKGSFADTISFTNSALKNCVNGLELAAETDDKGDYNAEFVYITDCELENIQKNVINYYRGGYDESTIGGNLFVRGSKFKNCGTRDKSKILLKTRGIINVSITKNIFEHNPVKLIALLWGEKNNRHSDNQIIGSAVVRVDRYLKQKLMY